MMVNVARPSVIWRGDNLYCGAMNADLWIAEPKIDGVRCIVHSMQYGLKCYTRHHKPLDVGEEIAMRLDDLVPSGDVWDCEFVRKTGKIHVFDVPIVSCYCNESPLSSRREELRLVVPRFGAISLVSWMENISALETALERGHEGVVFKKLDTRYPFGSTTDWLKCKG